MYYSNYCKKCGVHFHPRPGHPHNCARVVKPATWEVGPVVMVVVCKSCHHYGRVWEVEEVKGRRKVKDGVFEFVGIPTTRGLNCTCGRRNLILLNREKY